MRVMVTGSRDWRDVLVIQEALIRVQQDHPEENMILVNGCASGADAIARSVADFLCWDIEDFWPDYVSDAFAEANKLRNLAMVATRPDIILAFPTRRSRGTWHAVNAAKAAGIEPLIYSERSEFRKVKVVTGMDQV